MASIASTSGLQSEFENILNAFITRLHSGQISSDPTALGKAVAADTAKDLANAIDTWMQGVTLTIAPGQGVLVAIATGTGATSAPWTTIAKS